MGLTDQLIWSSFATTDIVIQTKGVLVPQGDVKHIQSSNNGTVVEIYVKNGDIVQKNQALLKIDTNVKADLLIKMEKLKAEYELKNIEFSSKNEILKSLEEQIKSTHELFEKESYIKNEMLKTAINSQKRVKEQHDIFLQMYKNNLISKIELLRDEDSLEKATTKIKELNNDIELIAVEKEKKLEELNSRMIALKIESEQIQTAIKDNRKNYTLLELQYKNKINIGGKNIDYDIITSPTDGVISFNQIKYVGDFVKSGTDIMTIIPNNKPLIAKIEIENIGVGRAKIGLPVKIKYDGYPYQQFGTGNGTLIYISPDSKQPDPNKQEFVYEALVELKEFELTKDSDKYPLFAGLSLVGEIVVDERELISFIFEFFKGKE